MAVSASHHEPQARPATSDRSRPAHYVRDSFPRNETLTLPRGRRASALDFRISPERPSRRRRPPGVPRARLGVLTRARRNTITLEDEGCTAVNYTVRCARFGATVLPALPLRFGFDIESHLSRAAAARRARAAVLHQ